MATGSMTEFRLGIGAWHSTALVILLLLLPLGSWAQDVGLAGIMGSKAMLMVNGGEPQAVPVGQTIGGVKLVSIQGDQVIVEIGGKKRPLKVGQHAIGVSNGDGSGKIIMTADAQGHFFTTGNINGISVRFLVDTGATAVSLGASDARRIGLDFNRGQKVLSNTANGQIVVSRVMLDTVRIADVTLHNVEATIQENEMPIALLGMSFLNRMEMQRDGSTMTLKKRF